MGAGATAVELLKELPLLRVTAAPKERDLNRVRAGRKTSSVFVKSVVLSVLVVTVAPAGCGHGNDGVDGVGPGTGVAAGPDGGGGAGGTAGTMGAGAWS